MKKLLSAVALGAVTVGLVCSARSKSNTTTARKVREGKLTLISKDLGKTIAKITVEYRLTNSGIFYNTDTAEGALTDRAVSLLNTFSDYVEDQMKNPAYGKFSLENTCSSFMAAFPTYAAYLD